VPPNYRTYLCPADPPLNTDGPWWACASAAGSITTAFVMDNLFDQSTITTEILTDTGTYDVAYPIQIRWKEGDLRITVPATGSIATTTSALSNIIITSAPVGASSTEDLATSSSVASSDNGGGGLSNAASIAIGTVIPALALILAVPTFYLAVKKMRKRK
jgi:hypothetical protein